MKPQNKRLSLITLGIAASLPLTTQAQEALMLEEIIVTAQRKSESLQDVPIAVNVATGEKLAAMGLNSTDDLQLSVPALTYATTGPAATPYLRGIGSNAGNPNDDPSVATYIDGVYLASPQSGIMGFNGIERVEVLKGPQGTLFGRNATGGVIQIVTRDPERDTTVEVNAGFANYRTTSGGIYASTGLGDAFAANISIQGESQDEGWGKAINRNNADTYENQSFSGRAKLVFTPNDDLTMKLSLDHSEVGSNQQEYQLPEGVVGIDGVTVGTGGYDSFGTIEYNGLGEPKIINRQNGAALHINYDTDALRFVSITAARDMKGSYQPEADTTPVPWVEGKLPTSAEYYSQEFQVMSNDPGWLDWVVGAYVFHNEAGYDDIEFSGLAFFDSDPVTPGGQPDGVTIANLFLNSHQTTDSVALYGQGTAEVATDTNLTVGLRYTDEEQEVETSVFGFDLGPATPEDSGYEELTWRLSLDHNFADGTLGYISYNRGIKGGGYDLLSPGAAAFEPEELDAYEIGVKSELLESTLRLNASYFYYDFKNIQVQVIPAGTGGIVATTNAAEAAIQGLDVDFQYLVSEGLTLSGGFALLDSEYKDFKETVAYFASPLQGGPSNIDASGNDTIRTPDFSGNLTAEYVAQTDVGEFPFSLTVSHSSGFYFGADNRLEQEAYTVLNAAAGWNSNDEQYGINIWVRNLTDEYYWAQGVPSGFGDLVSPAAPRTFGITFNAKFGG